MTRAVGYWWDFRHHNDGSMTCIVECDHRKADGFILAEFQDVAQAEACVADLRAGRRSMHEMLKEQLP